MAPNSSAFPIMHPKNPTECHPQHYADWAPEIIRLTEVVLDQLLPRQTLPPTQLHSAMRYSLFSGGKRMRPLLCHAAGALVDARLEALSPVAAAIEMIHIFSLSQDDLPAMDNDRLRHGKPAVHAQYGVATTLLACDGLLAQAFLTLSEVPLPDPCRTALTHVLASAIGTAGLAGGQCIDLMSVGKTLNLTELEQMHRMKTGALIQAAVRMGALCGPHDNVDLTAIQQAMTEYGDAMGLAFQIVDDILDVTANPLTLGKTLGKDALASKPTYVSLLGLDASRQQVRQLRERACDVLAPYGKKAEKLRWLIEKIADRRH